MCTIARDLTRPVFIAALIAALGAAAPAFARPAHAPVHGHASIVHRSSQPAQPEQCWMPTDQEHGYGYPTGCNTPNSVRAAPGVNMNRTMN